MGWNLVAAVVDHQALGGTLSDRAYRALTFMCWRSRDKPSDSEAAAEYSKGHVAIAMHLLGMERGGEPAGRQAARRAVRELIDAGLIEHVDGGVGRRETTYRILIGNRWAPPVDNSDQEPLIRDE